MCAAKSEKKKWTRWRPQFCCKATWTAWSETYCVLRSLSAWYPQHQTRVARYSMDLLKFKLTIAYDGTEYEGWQVQKIGTGVQEKVEAALAKLFPSHPRLHSSSRTDTGVHALGMIAHFEVSRAEARM